MILYLQAPIHHIIPFIQRVPIIRHPVAPKANELVEVLGSSSSGAW